MASPRTTRLPGFLTTRFGRRLFGVFVLSALLPITALAALAFVQVTGELYQQAEQRLRSASRAAGMRIFDRLAELEAELGAIEPDLVSGGEAHRIEPSRRARLSQRFRALWLIGSGEVYGLLGDAREPPAIDLQGRTARLVLERHGDAFAIYLARRLEAESDSSLIAIGDIEPNFLFDISPENALPPLSEFVLLDCENEVLASSWEASREDLRLITSTLPDGESSLVEWRRGGTTFLARSWSLFLEASYGHPSWRIIVVEPKELALAPIIRFRTSFPLVVGASVALIALLTTAQIRRRLLPLETLRAGTPSALRAANSGCGSRSRAETSSRTWPAPSTRWQSS